MEKAFKFRIYPNTQQIHRINQMMGCVRFVYNHYLALRISKYEQEEVTFSYNACSKDLTDLKKELEWLNDVDSTALQSSLKNLDTSYKNFFHGSGYPKFKKKHDHYHSYTSKCNHNSIAICVDEKKIKLPKLGLVNIRLSKHIEGRILSCTVSKNCAGQYYVSVLCTDIKRDPIKKTGQSIGIDMGLHNFCTLSNGLKYSNPKCLIKSEKKLAKLQQSLSRKTRGSHNYNKANLKVAKLNQHISNQRQDYLHKYSTELVRSYDVISMEDLKVSEMIQHNSTAISKSIADVSWSEFKRQIQYKCDWYGKQLIEVDTYYPSSQLCCHCGVQNPLLKNLSIRNWDCPSCNTRHDRDINAAININNEGLRLRA